MFTVYLWMFVKLLVGFILIISYLHLTGRNQIGMMSAVDLIGNFILGGVVGGVLYNDKLPFHHYIALLVLCIAMMVFFNYILRKIPILRKRTIGEPITIIRNGRFLIDNFNENASRIDLKDIATALRMQNIFSFDNIQFAQIETTGHVSVIMDDEAKKPSRFLIYRGEVLESEMEASKIDKSKLDRELSGLGIFDRKNVFLAEWVDDHMLAVLNDGTVFSSARGGKRETAVC